MGATADDRSATDPRDSGLGDADGFSDTADPGIAIHVDAAQRTLDRSAPLTVEPGTATAERIAALRASLMTPMPGDRLWGWIGPLLVTLFAAVLRFTRLSAPNQVMFDETYYAKDAWSILKHGVEWNWISVTGNPDYVNNQVIAGHYSA